MPTGISGLYQNTKGAKEAEREKVQGMCDFELCEAARVEIEKAKAETAAEIFAEIEPLFNRNVTDVEDLRAFLDIKNKRTKGGAGNE